MAARKKTTGEGDDATNAPDVAETAEAAAPEKIGKAKASGEAAPSTPQELATKMAQDGVPEAVIIATLNATYGGGDGQGQTAAPGQPRTPGGGETLGPDPAIVAAYHARINDPSYKKAITRKSFNPLRSEDPKLQELLFQAVSTVEDEWSQQQVVEHLCDALDGFGGVSLPLQFNQWCVQWQYWQQSIRRMKDPTEFTEAKVLEDMIRFHWFNHRIERAQMQAARNPNQTSGPAGMFSPAAGGWTKP